MQEESKDQFSSRSPLISLCISLFEGTDLWQPAECQQRVQSQHGGADGRFVPSHEEADCGRDEDFSDSRAPQPHTCSTLVCRCTCPVSAAPWSNLLSCLLSLSILLPRFPASAQGPFETLLPVLLVHFLFSSSQGSRSPNSVSQRCLNLFCLNHVAWPKPGPFSALLLRRTLPDPPAKPRASSSFRIRAAHLQLSSHCWPGRSAWSSPLWESTCGKGVKSTFLQLSSEKRGSQARIWAAGGCFIAGGIFGTPP